MNRKKCVVKDCDTQQITGERTVGHQFPTTKSRGTLWIDCTGNKDLKMLTLQQITSKRLFICMKHFTPNNFYYTQNGVRRLASDAVPTLHLPKLRIEHRNPISIDLPDKENSSLTTNVLPVLYEASSMGQLSVHQNEDNSYEVRESSLRSSTLKSPEPSDIPINNDTNRLEFVSVTMSQSAEVTKMKENEPLVKEEEELMEAEEISVKIERQEQEDENQKKIENELLKIEPDEEDPLQPNIKKIKLTKCRSVRYHTAKNRKVFRICDLTTPLEKMLYGQLQETREENYRLKKSRIRYLNLLKYYRRLTKYTGVSSGTKK